MHDWNNVVEQLLLEKKPKRKSQKKRAKKQEKERNVQKRYIDTRFEEEKNHRTRILGEHQNEIEIIRTELDSEREKGSATLKLAYLLRMEISRQKTTIAEQQAELAKQETRTETIKAEIMEKVQIELKKNHEELLKFHELYLKQQEMMKEIQSGAMTDVRATKDLLVELQKQTGDLVQIQRDHEESLNKKLMDLEDNKARRHAELISKTASADTKEKRAPSPSPSIASSSSSSMTTVSKASSKSKKSSKSITPPPKTPSPEPVIKSANSDQLKVNQQVLSRITQEVEDGWFYSAQVISVDGEKVRVSYNSKIIDATMADIVKLSGPDVSLEAEATVIARHPHYQQTYAPGVIVCSTPLQIRFYDGTESIIPKAEVHLVDFERFEDFVDNIIQLESRWVNESVVARDDKTGVYKLGTVKERVANAHEYVIEWRGDNTSTIQHYSCIFGKYSKAKSLQTGDHVIACSDKKTWHYYPGIISKAENNKVDIDFVCNTTIEGANPKEAFYITPEYFNLAKEYYLAQLEGSAASSESSMSSVSD